MCGICGTIGGDRSQVEAMLERIKHRGPDGSGVHGLNGGAIHGHARLAILDPTPASAQPFAYRGEVLSFNGEIWNFIEIRHALRATGNEFSTDGDTEVLSMALHVWGLQKTLEEIDGMFCFSWTNEDGDTFLVRDRLGKLPLYVFIDEETIFWASERKAFGEDAGDAVAVPPGHYFCTTSKAMVRYFDLVPSKEPNADPDYVEVQIQRAVERRMISDAPLCTLLSGGVDSSLVAAIAAKVRPDIKAYTVAVEGWPESSDLIAAREVADHCGIELREVLVPAPMPMDAKEAVRCVEVSLNKTAVEIATLCMPLARRIRADGFKVCLSGEAADELFGGYGTLARRAGSDDEWRQARMEFLAKMGRADFHRVNKSFMNAGVEARTPFCDLWLVKNVLGMTRHQCPPGKSLLRHIAERWLPEKIAWRDKETFHGSAGVRRHFDEVFAAYGTTPQVAYNKFAREIFGKVVKG